MFQCPHCHKSIEIGIGPDGKVPWYRHDLTPGLGCGSLVVIAVIVYLCSGGFRDDEDFRKLRDEVRELATKVETLTNAIKPPEAAAAARDRELEKAP